MAATILSSRPFQWLADITYDIYLTHVFVSARFTRMPGGHAPSIMSHESS